MCRISNQSGSRSLLTTWLASVVWLACMPGLIGCATVTVPEGEALTVLSAPDDLPNRHLAAMDTLDVAAEEAYVELLHDVMWKAGYTIRVREAAMQRLVELDQAGLQRQMRLKMPNLGLYSWLRVLCDEIAERQWTELTPALVSSLARPAQFVEADEERPEYKALAQLHGEERISDVVFETFRDSNRASLQRLRERAWELLHRMGERDRLLRLLAESQPESSDLLLTDLHAAVSELGIAPHNREEIIWLRKLRQPEHADLWSEARATLSDVSAERRAAIELRDLPVVVAARRHTPDVLRMSDEALFNDIQQRLSGRKHYSHQSAYASDNHSMSIRQMRDKLTWGDMLAIRCALAMLEVPQVVSHLFDFAARDREDETTEYGGIIALDDRGRFEILEFIPRIRENDQKFIPSQRMYDAGYDAIFHFHYHVQKIKNAPYAGPGYGDHLSAGNSRSNNLVFTSVDEGRMNVDYYRHDHVVVDLGTVDIN